jgi:hypothetical protein
MNIRWEYLREYELYRCFFGSELVAKIWHFKGRYEAMVWDWCLLRDRRWREFFPPKGVSIQEAKRLCEKEVVHAIARKICEGEI